MGIGENKRKREIVEIIELGIEMNTRKETKTNSGKRGKVPQKRNRKERERESRKNGRGNFKEKRGAHQEGCC